MFLIVVVSINELCNKKKYKIYLQFVRIFQSTIDISRHNIW